MCGIWGYFGSDDYDNKILYEHFINIEHRGPDNHSFQYFNHLNNHIYLGFHRLAIMDFSVNGNQPFNYEDDQKIIFSICNGEIYNYKELIKKYNLQNELKSKSDCEILIPLYNNLGANFIDELDGEFAFIIYEFNKETNTCGILVSRDIIGVRPLFMGLINGTNGLVFSSEAKGLLFCDKITPFKPGTFMIYNLTTNSKETEPYYSFDYKLPNTLFSNDYDSIYSNINHFLTEAVDKRLQSDREIGCLLSGGLDSSLVCAIANKLMKDKYNKTLKVFTITLDDTGPDIRYARKVAKHIGCELTEIKITREEALDVIPDIIYTCESYDTTTIRASTMQYLLGKYIKEKTNVKVLLSGELSDELLQGYLYFYKAPSSIEGFKESVRLVKDVYLFDGLRTDRTLAKWGLEVRLPFTDRSLIDYVYSLNVNVLKPQLVNKKLVEKHLLRKSFEQDNIIPYDVLFRKKDAFSDAVSNKMNSWHNTVKRHIKLNYMMTEQEYYLKIFDERIGKKFRNLIPYYWMPKWINCNDPSARELDVYE